ncbi:hypothetical protein GpartN1_g7475.t1 [Galdieria partita]|uniref:Magnesium transporter n=1 Tax=Galdieria partita TaxID=83374 RepID=A0A9C7UTS1_9RHOD|nr:hypothetical protein GpartN1_g7475.t1 [Galdieria partita]
MSCLWKTTLQGFVSASFLCTRFNPNKLVYSKLYQNFRRQLSCFDNVQFYMTVSTKRKSFCSVVRGDGRGNSFSGTIEEITIQRERIIRNEAIAAVPLVCIEIDVHGNIASKQVQKTELASFLKLNFRDLRVVDPSFRNESPVFLARKNAVIVHFEHIRAVIQATSLLLFDPPNPSVQNFIPSLRSRIRDRSHPLPFEFRSLEAILIDVCTSLGRQLRTLVPAVENVLDTLSSNDTGADTVRLCLDRLLPLQNSLNEFEVKIREAHTALNDVLRSDEDMSEMYLTTKLETGHRRRVDQHEEVEMMFETYLKQIDSMRNEVASTIQTVRVTENITQIRLDAMRNRILRLEVYLNLGMLSLSTGAFCSGLFGMNLTSHMEDHPYAFYLVSASLLGFSAFAFFISIAWIRLKRIFQ